MIVAHILLTMVSIQLHFAYILFAFFFVNYLMIVAVAGVSTDLVLWIRSSRALTASLVLALVGLRSWRLRWSLWQGRFMPRRRILIIDCPDLLDKRLAALIVYGVGDA